ncbi:sensor histidine kinase [Lysinibacillus sp. 54212]|uniref:sensor histidine kinase n=1 Tax=Lysinibacillus sp. 54212 TaxID=3119829 RepID=UPI002FC747C5
MKSLYSKFVVVTISIMLFSGLLSFLFSNLYYQYELKPYNDMKTASFARSIASFPSENPTVDVHEYLQNVSSIGYQIYLVGEDGEKRFFGAPFRDKELPDQVIESVLRGEEYHGILQFQHQIFVTGFFANELNNSIGVPLTYNDENYALFLRPNIKLLFNEMHLLFAALLGFTIFLSIVFVLFSTKYLVKPISKLTTATSVIANGQYDIQLDISRKDELGELSNSFIMMAQKLGKAEETRKEFISNISHDIQSPLSNIQGYTSLLEKEHLSSEEKTKYVGIINGEIRRLSSLTKQLLLLASLDRNEDILKERVFNVSKQIRELVQNYQWQIQNKNIMLSFSLQDIELKGDPALLNTVWDNILSNAIKYNRSNGSIDITVKEQEGKIIIEFEDTGIGISEQAQTRIFDRFYRVDSARTRTIEGTGLGLSIVFKIVSMHNGHIVVKSEEDVGTKVTIIIPSYSS